MSDRVAVMNAGRLEQVGAPREIYDRPASPSWPTSSARRTSSSGRRDDRRAARAHAAARRGHPGGRGACRDGGHHDGDRARPCSASCAGTTDRRCSCASSGMVARARRDARGGTAGVRPWARTRRSSSPAKRGTADGRGEQGALATGHHQKGIRGGAATAFLAACGGSTDADEEGDDAAPKKTTEKVAGRSSTTTGPTT